MKVLVINPNSSSRHDVYSKKRELSFPLGLAYIISVVKKYTNDIKLLDLHLQADILNSFAEGLKRIDPPTIVLIGGMSTVYHWIKAISKLVKEVFPQTIIICGGSVATSMPEILLNNTAIDIAVLGEGENTAEEIFKTLKSQEGIDSINYRPGLDWLAGIKGISYKKALSVMRNGPRPRIEDLDSIDFPDFHFFDTEKYIQSGVRVTGCRSLPIIISRGCPFNCNFCYRNFGHKIKYRSVENAIEEIKKLKTEFHLDYIVLWDELPLFDKEWAKNFAQTLISRSLKISWVCAGRASSLSDSDSELLKLLKRSGLRRISFGIESGSNDMLKRMNKHLTVEQSERALKVTRKAGIKATASFMIGYPGETPDTIEKSVDFCKKNLLKTTFYICVATPRTRIYSDCIEKGIIQDQEKYIDSISRIGDASQLNINMTEMSDDELLRYKKDAENAINRFNLSNHMRYYGAVKGVLEIIKALFLFIRRKYKRCYFDSP